MTDVFICDYIRTPIGRYAGRLSSVRADDLGAIPLRALMARKPGVDWEAVETGGRRSLSTMCIGVGQGITIALERV